MTRERYPWCAGKVLARAEASVKAAELRRAGKTLVTVNGSFDLLHAGHVVILTEAKAQGDVLFVGVNTDHSLQQYKGLGRPIIPETERLALLAALACTDYLVPIDAPEAGREIVRIVQPHVHVNGSEYGPKETWVEWTEMQDAGVRAHTVVRRPGLASTDIIRRIQDLPR